VTTPSRGIGHEPGCVVTLIGRLGEAADAFAAGKALGPYLVDALLEDVELCPALTETSAGRETLDLLRKAIEKARINVRVTAACPSVEKEWAARELRTAVARAQAQLEAWRADVAAHAQEPPGEALCKDLERIASPRCPGCTFATG